MHYPPPVHGAAMVGKYIKESKNINTTFECRYINLSTSERVDEIGKGGLTKWLRFFSILWQSVKGICSFRPHLVYFTLTASGVGFYKDALIALTAKCLGKKVVYHFHNKGIQTRQDKWFDNLLYRMVFRNAEVILLAEELYVDVEKYVPRNRVYFCPNGIPDLASNTNSFKANDTIEILFLSNLIDSKGVSILLQACSLLRDKGLEFQCTFIGGEGDISETVFEQKLEALNLEKQVKYVGKKFGAEKEDAYAKADIFTLPTYYSNECFPLVLIEAMQFSLPLVSTREGGVPSIIKEGETGFLVAQKNALALAEKLEILLLNPELRAKMGAAGRKHFEKSLTLAAFESTFASILENLIDKRANTS